MATDRGKFLPVPTDPNKTGPEIPRGTDQAINPEYLRQLHSLIDALPKRRDDLAPTKRPYGDATQGTKWQDDLENRVEYYLSPYLKGGYQLDPPVPSFNPFNLPMPAGLQNIDAWLREQQKDWQYKSPWSRTRERQQGSYVNEWTLRQTDDDFIRVVRAWNQYHLGFLETLNAADLHTRRDQIESLGQTIFTQTPDTILSQKSTQELSPYDNPRLWMIYSALNVLICPDDAVSPVAKFRAIEVLSTYDTADLIEEFFKPEEYGQPQGRWNPSLGWIEYFKKNLLRLPRAFWETPQDRTQPLHEHWWDNSHIHALFGEPKPGHRRVTNYDYGQIFNQLVTQHPNEAVHIALLMLTDSSLHTAAFSGIIAMAKLNPIAVQTLFGPQASYLRIHLMPADVTDQIDYGLGLATYDADLAANVEGLTKEQLMEVIRQLRFRIAMQEEALRQRDIHSAETYFATTAQFELNQIDPQGYWQLLGVNPFMDPADLGEAITRAYRSLAKKYHPDGEQPDENKMKRLNAAYEILNNPQKRADYGRR